MYFLKKALAAEVAEINKKFLDDLCASAKNFLGLQLIVRQEVLE